MIRALANLRILVAMLVLSMAIAVGMAPGPAFAANPCDQTVSSHGHETSGSSITAHIPHDTSHEHRAQAGDCCTPCVVTYCCAWDVPANADAKGLLTVTALSWQPERLSALTGLGPFGDFRPPRRIG
jgi:hypothetical protein